MKKNSILSKLYNGICKDTGSLNESKKLIIVVRILTLTMIAYSLFNGIIMALNKNSSGFLVSVVSIIFFILVMVSTYHCKPFTSYCILNVYILVWIVVNVIAFGWNIGVQLFIITLLVFCFYAKYGHELYKILYVIMLCILRIFLYYHCMNKTPLITLSSQMNDSLQLVNTIAIMWSIAMICYYFSKDSQALEGKLVAYNEQLINQANTDTLTGLYNRRCTMDYLGKLFEDPHSQISICLCDIDFFKRVNDTYGHNVGDVVLKGIAETFRKVLPETCFCSRWGGEEFLLIFPASNGDEAHVLLESLRHAISGISFNGGGEPFHVTMTFGLVEYDYRSDLTTILKQADDKLYVGKESGRDRIVY